MRRTGKWLSLLLAMVMFFSLLAVTVAACDLEDGHVHTEACEEGIMPHGSADPIGPPCRICGSTTQWVQVGGSSDNPKYAYVCTYSKYGQ